MATRKIKGVTVMLGGEHRDKNGYFICNECGSKTMLVATSGEWGVDEEGFKSGEETPEGTPEAVYIGEVSGHWCPDCEILVSLSYNFEERS